MAVPKGIPGSVLVQIVSGDSTNGAGSSPLANGAHIEATLRGQSFEPRTVFGRPNEALPLPPLNLSGDYQLENIRLVDTATGEVRMEGDPSSVPVHVFEEVLVSRVTSRPLTAQEIQEKGIFIDDRNFRAVEFQVQFVLDGQTIPIKFPVVAPSFKESTEIIPAAELESRLQQASVINQQIASQIAEVPAAFQAAGIQLQVQGINFQIVEESDIDLALQIPPIPSLMVIPGNIGFLNQFLSVQIFTENASPQGSGLTVNHVMARLNLPPGEDNVVSTNYDVPGDDPLRFARIGPNKIIQSTQTVVRPGPDGKVGTADDISRLGPGDSGQAEFLVEGLLEGLHVMDLDLTADLEGLAAGVVKIKGKAAGSVLVRNPRFSLAFSHPRTVRFGEPYDASVTVMNTSVSPANFVSVTLHQSAIQGAIFEGDQSEKIDLGTIESGQTATATWHLRSQRTGAISFSNLTTGTNSVNGVFRLRMGVDERGVVLSPDAIGMPDFVTNLPPNVVNAAVRVLGQALSVATAAQLPPGVARVPRSIITQRVLELAEAGQRLRYSDELRRVLPDLLLDWQGGRTYEPGFDQIVRETGAGLEWRTNLMAAIEAAETATALRNATERLQDRAADFTGLGQAFVLAAANAGRTTIDFADGTAGATPEVSHTPHAAVYHGTRGDWGVTAYDSSAVVTWTFTNAPSIRELGVLLVRSNGTATQLLWPNPPPAAIYRYALGDATGQLLVDVDGDGQPESRVNAQSSAVLPAPTQLLAVEQDLTVNAGRPAKTCSGPPWANYGTVVAVAFSKPVSQGTAGDPASFVLDNGLRANSVQIQPSGRVAFLNLEQGISAIRPRKLSISGIRHACGTPMPDCAIAINSVNPITHELFKEGAVIKGRVVRGNGSAAINVPVTLTMYDQSFNEFDASCDPRPVRISQVFTGTNGQFEFEFVMAGIPYSVSATDTSDLSDDVVALILQSTTRDQVDREALLQLANSPENQDTLLQAFAVGALPQAIAKVEGLDRAILYDTIPQGSIRQGQEVPVALRFRGRATVTGQVVAEDGLTPVPGAAVNLFPDTDSRELGRGVFADNNGRFAFFGVPLGIFSLDVKTSDARYRTVAGVLNAPGQITNLVVALPRIGTVTLKTSLRGQVFEADGVTIHPNARIYIGKYGGGNLVVNLVASLTADGNGFWDAPNVPESSDNTFDLVAVSFDGRHKGVRQAVATTPGQLTFVNITMEGSTVVTGRVFSANGQAVSNAVVGGGVALARTDANGYFGLEGVPLGRRSFTTGVGRSNSIPAFAFPRFGSASIDVVAGVENFVTIYLNAAGSIAGTVSDFGGVPVTSRMRVAIPREGGFLWTETDEHGKYSFENLSPATYTVSAPANAVAQTDTSGLVQQIQTGDQEQILAAINEAFNIFTGATDPFLNGDQQKFNPPTWGFSRATIQFDGDIGNGNIRMLTPGTVSGRVLNDQDTPIGARVRLTGVGPTPNGDVGFVIRGELNSDPATGQFAFPGQVLEGAWELQAASPFYRVVIRTNGVTSQIAPFATNLVLQFPPIPPPLPPSVQTTGWLAGVVFDPGGTPVGEGVRVAITNAGNQLIGVEVHTDTNGAFFAAQALPVGTYRVEAVNDETGLRGLAYASLQADITNRTSVRLLGQGVLRVTVLTADGAPANGAFVNLESGSYPYAGRLPILQSADSAGQTLFTGLFEGSFAVCASRQEGATAVYGRAAASVMRDATNDVTVRLSATGTIEGVFVTRDRNGIPDAQIAIGSLGFATTQSADPAHGISNGFFRIVGVPPGTYTLVARDPVTGTGGVGSTTIPTTPPNQTNYVTLVEQSRGEIDGHVIGSYRDEFVPGATVILSVSDGLTPSRTVTTGPDGSFSFPGAPAGRFTLSAIDPRPRVMDPHGGLSGSAAGVLPEDTAAVTVDIAIEALDLLQVRILRSDGHTAATNTQVTLERLFAGYAQQGATVTATNGLIRFTDLRLGGPYVVTAVDNSNPWNAARTSLTVTPGGTNQTNDLVLRGTGAIRCTVLDSGGAVLPGQRVSLTIGASLFANTILELPTDGQGVINFDRVPVGTYRLSAARGALGASAAGEIRADGQQDEVTLRLDNSGFIRGILLRTDGATPVAAVNVVLNYGSGFGVTAVASTDPDGAFHFDSIPLGQFKLSASVPSVSPGGGLAFATGVLLSNLQVAQVTMVLDEDFPRVVAIKPLPTAVEVPTTTAVDIDFSEPLDVNTVPQGGIFLRRLAGGGAIAATTSVLPDDLGRTNQRVRLAPVQRLQSQQTYQVVVLSGDLIGAGGGVIARGPRDRVGHSLNATFFSTFTTADNDPPILLSNFPTNGAVQIEPLAVVRLTFNEPIRSNVVVTLQSANGMVTGAVSVQAVPPLLNFTPTAALEPNHIYTLTISNVVDLAGNAWTNGVLSVSFASLDTVGPTIAGFRFDPKAAVAGSTLEVEAVPGTNEPVAQVSFFQEFDLQHAIGVATNSPFKVNVLLPTGGSTRVQATAVDRFGNVGPVAQTNIAVLANQPPTVSFVRLDPMTGALTNGQSFTFQVSAADDVGISNISVVGVATSGSFTFTTNFTRGAAQSNTLTVPANIVPGSSINFYAQATDPFGLTSERQSLQYDIIDGAPPFVELLYPTNNALLTSNVLQLLVASSDNGGNHSLQVSLSGALFATQSMTVVAAPNEVVTNRFTNSLAGVLTDGTPLQLTLRASDPAGHVTLINLSFALAALPQIVLQPQGRHAGVGSNVTFTVFTFGTAPLFYQWRKDGIALSARTNATLALNSLSGADQGQYSVTVSNVFGAVTSSNAPLAFVSEPPSILIEPQSVVAGVGATVRFSVQAVAQENASYQWTFFSTNLASGIDLPGATNALLTLTNVNSPNVGAYQLRVADALGSVQSEQAWLILTNNTDGLPWNSSVAGPLVTVLLLGSAPPAGLNTTVAQPPVSLLLISPPPNPDLPFNTTIGQPPVSLFLLGTGNIGGLALNTTVAEPPTSMFLLGTTNTGDLALNTTVGEPTASLFLLGTANTGGLVLNTTVAQPPVLILTNSAGFRGQADALAAGSLLIVPSPDGLWIRWNSSDSVLQSSTNLEAWVDVAGAIPPYRVPSGRHATEFFRLRSSTQRPP